MNILVVDDHPMSVAGYIASLRSNENFLNNVNFFQANSCEGAINEIEKKKSQDPFTLCIIDQGLPGYKEKEILSGSDLVPAIRKKMPGCKIIIITAHTEIIIIYDILKKVRPDGLIIKNDITPGNLPQSVMNVLNGDNVQSTTVKNIVQEIWKKDLMVDDTNRQILIYLSKGYKIKDLQDVLSLSVSPIQRRIAQMKDAFNVTEESSLLRIAIEQGFL